MWLLFQTFRSHTWTLTVSISSLTRTNICINLKNVLNHLMTVRMLLITYCDSFVGCIEKSVWSHVGSNITQSLSPTGFLPLPRRLCFHPRLFVYSSFGGRRLFASGKSPLHFGEDLDQRADLDDKNPAPLNICVYEIWCRLIECAFYGLRWCIAAYSTWSLCKFTKAHIWILSILRSQHRDSICPSFLDEKIPAKIWVWFYCSGGCRLESPSCPILQTVFRIWKIKLRLVATLRPSVWILFYWKIPKCFR